MVGEFFRRIENPNKLRRNILESSKEIIQNLKSYQKILEIREKRKDKEKQLRIEIKEINMFMDKVRDLFPSELLIEFEQEKKKEEGRTTKKKSVKSKKKGSTNKSTKKLPAPSEVAKLENALSSIEKKLQSLS